MRPTHQQATTRTRLTAMASLRMRNSRTLFTLPGRLNKFLSVLLQWNWKALMKKDKT